jgi:hypothetical protein
MWRKSSKARNIESGESGGRNEKRKWRKGVALNGRCENIEGGSVAAENNEGEWRYVIASSNVSVMASANHQWWLMWRKWLANGVFFSNPSVSILMAEEPE